KKSATENMRMLKGHAPATTAHRHKPPSNPTAAPALNPAAARTAWNVEFARPEPSELPSASNSPLRETVAATKPHASDPATAEATARRHAMFDTGSNTVKSHP